LVAADRRIRVLSFSRNFGHQVAISAGIDAARGDAVVVIDADLQDPPEVIAEMHARWSEGNKVVYGVRTRRDGERPTKKLTARWFYRLLGRLSDTPMTADSGDFRLLDRQVVEALKTSNEVTSVGRLPKDYQQFLVLSTSELASLDDVRHVVAAFRNQTPVYVGDIAEVLLSMFGSTEFWAEEFGEGPGKPKTPIEYVVSAIRAVDGEVSNANASVTGYLSNMGMPLYQCIPPTGYSFRGADWVNPSTQLYRMNFALDLAAGRIGGVAVDARTLARGASLSDPKAISAAFGAAVIGPTLSQQTLDTAAQRLQKLKTKL
jgi:glycosyltransferase involved in cell wall biosynthesis